ncbi:hypothetical protein RintRC_5158 [Richelia intracellularis]|nr:hypothetical protein RintRC_5158 [Richelia intracellularis]
MIAIHQIKLCDSEKSMDLIEPQSLAEVFNFVDLGLYAETHCLFCLI